MDVRAIIDVLTEDYGYVASLIAFAFIVFSFCIAYRNRNKLVIKIVPMSKDLPDSFKTLDLRIREVIAEITQIHRKAKDAASDINLFREGNLSMPAEGEAIAVKEEFEKLIKKKLKAPVKLLELIFKWVFRPPKLIGQVFLAKSSKDGNYITGDISIRCRYVPRQKSSEVVHVDPAVRSGIVDEKMEEIAKELALKILLVLSNDPGTASWRALGKVTDALKVWPDTEIKSQEADIYFAESERILKEALKIDVKSPLVNYNLALILYYEYGDRTIGDAIKYFNLSTQTPICRFHYLGKIGLSRCYCQNYHRLGKQTPKDLKRARAYADEAVNLIEEEKAKIGLEQLTGNLKVDHVRAKYCQAFAQHVTEKDDDIDKGIGAYLEILKLYCKPPNKGILSYPMDLSATIKFLNKNMPAVPAVIYNNLGYILMVRGGRFHRKNDNSDNFYRMAKGFLKLALRRDSNYRFAHANIGNIERLLRNFDQAVYHYEIAIGLDPKYVNGYSELSWVYLDCDQPDKAWKNHKKALEFAKLDSHKSKIKEYFARAHWRINEIDQSKALVIEAIEFDKESENYELSDWIKSEEELYNFLLKEQVEWSLLK